MGAQSMFRKGPTIKRKAEKLYAILVTPNEGSGTRVSIEGTESKTSSRKITGLKIRGVTTGKYANIQKVSWATPDMDQQSRPSITIKHQK